MIKVRIRPFISGSVDWFPPNTVIPGPESDVIWWIVTNFVVICAVTFFIMKRSISLFTTLFFFYRDPSIIWSYSIRPLSWPMFISPLSLSPTDSFYFLCFYYNGQQQKPQYAVLHAVNTLIDSTMTNLVKVISSTENAIPLLSSTSRFFFFYILIINTQFISNKVYNFHENSIW